VQKLSQFSYLASVAPTTVFFTDAVCSIGTRDETFCFETCFGCKSDAFSSTIFTEELFIAAGSSVATALETKITWARHFSIDRLGNMSESQNKILPYAIILFSVIGWILATGSGKEQWVRLVDILLYGPYLVYLSIQTNYVFSAVEKLFLAFLGATTITYNLRNYVYN
jgi:hypothetical protein